MILLLSSLSESEASNRITLIQDCKCTRPIAAAYNITQRLRRCPCGRASHDTELQRIASFFYASALAVELNEVRNDAFLRDDFYNHYLRICQHVSLNRSTVGLYATSEFYDASRNSAALGRLFMGVATFMQSFAQNKNKMKNAFPQFFEVESRFRGVINGDV